MPPVRIVSKRTARDGTKLRTMAASMRVLLALSCCIGLTLAGLTALAVVLSWMMTFVGS